MSSGIYKRINPVSQETRNKISNTLKGKMPKFIPDNKGVKRTDEYKQALSRTLKKEYAEGKRIPWNKYSKGLFSHGAETRLKMSLSHKGVKHWNWKGGITKPNLRNTGEYKLWRNAVLTRDGRKCIWCKSTVRLEADHIKPFAYYPELRFAIDNGRTLCKDCHIKTDTYGAKSKN